jgi:hypothetical protein
MMISPRFFVLWWILCTLCLVGSFLVNVPVGRIGRIGRAWSSVSFKPFLQRRVFVIPHNQSQLELAASVADIDAVQLNIRKLRRFLKCKFPGIGVCPVDQLKFIVESLRKHDLSLAFVKSLLKEFMKQSFQSFSQQTELAGHIKKQFRLTDNEINRVFIRKPFLLSVPKKQFEEMENYLRTNLSCSEKELKTFLLMKKLPESDLSLPNLQKYCRFLFEEYSFPPAKTKNLLLAHPDLFRDQLIYHFAERKRILEDVFGPGVLKKNSFHLQAEFGFRNIFVCPPEQLYSMINLLMNIFQASKASELRSFIGVQAGILTCSLDYIQMKTDFYSSFFQGKKVKSLSFPLKSPTQVSRLVKETYKKIARELFQNEQIELEKKYNITAESEQTYCKKPADSNDDDMVRQRKKGSDKRILQDEFTLYKHYLISAKNGESEEEEQDNLYERFVEEVLEDYQQDDSLNILKEIDPAFVEMIEERLKNNGSSLTDLYRELWRESEAMKFSPSEALKLIKDLHLFGGTFRMLLTRIGVLTTALGLRKNELMSILFVSLS